MFKPIIYCVLLAVLVTNAHASVSFVGSDETTLSNWRTAAELEADEEYGSDGYVIYGLITDDAVYTNPYDSSTTNPDSLVSLPPYIADITLEGASAMWSGNGNFGQIEDPANGNALTNTPLLANGDADPWVFTITRSVGQAFRLTVMLSNGDSAPSNWVTTVGDGESASNDFSVPDNSSATYYQVFDISGGSGPVTVSVEYVAGGSQFNVTGFAFDSVAAQASNPSPADTASDVPGDVTLSWTPFELAQTHDVYFGTSFEDVNDADRDNPLDVLASEDQAATTFDAGRLEFGQTYYWRIDEVNAPPDKTIFKGSPWSFTVEPVSYAIPIGSVSATASSVDAAQEPVNTVNGSGLNENDEHATTIATMWLAKQGDSNPWIQFELDAIQKLDKVHLWNHNSETESILGFGIREALVETSTDGVTWNELGVFEVAQAPGSTDYAGVDVPLNGVVARYVKLTGQSNWSVLPGFEQIGLSEVRFFAIPVYARRPQPEDGGTIAGTEVTLQWRAGREADTHDVVLSSDPDAVLDGSALIGTTAENSFVPDPLEYSTTYFWRIDEVNEAAVPTLWEGGVWSFMTPDYRVIDDFEKYADKEFLEIWAYWADGYEDPSNGSVVGNGNVGERTIVHEGSQSMPIYYDNSGTAISEVTYEVDGEDWTVSGIQSLSLFFHGVLGNTGQLYLKINDTEVDYSGAPGDIAVSVWQPWIVDLTALGDVTQNVTSLTIGVRDSGANGSLYIDDIRLYPLAPETIVPVAPDDAGLVAYYALDGDATDSSGNGVHGTENGAPMYEAGVEGQCIRLNGIDDFVDFGVPENWPSGAAPRTLCAWAQTYSVEPGYRVIVSYGSPAGSQATGLVMNGTALYASGYGSDVSAGSFWDTEEWHQVGLTYDGTTLRLYADGIEAAVGDRAWDTAITVARIGRQVNDAREFWDGRIDEVRLYDQALSAAEMAGLAGRTDPIFKPF